jgi:hypothetical protein
MTSVPKWARPGWAYRSTDAQARASIAAAQSPRERGAGWGPVADPKPISTDHLLQAVRVAFEFADSKLVFSVSHDDYVSISGGLQNCVRDEQQRFSETGWVYLHICPCYPKPHLGSTEDPKANLMVVILNGRRVGVATVASLLTVLRAVSAGRRRTIAVVHHLLGHAPEAVADMVEATGCTAPIVWAHDLFALCPSVHLLRNDVAFCDAPPVQSTMCGVCVFGAERQAHQERIKSFFQRLNPLVVAPSELLGQYWARNAGVRFRAMRVAPPGAVQFSSKRAERFEGNRAMRVGFLGQPHYHKGWHVFEGLAQWFSEDSRYAFFILGEGDPGLEGVAHIPVSVGIANRTAMAEAVRQAGLDVVVNWSLCKESFSFTTLEAIAGGAFVVARRDAGNVWSLVASIRRQRGVAIATEDDLHALFIGDELATQLRYADRRYGDLVFNPGTYAVAVEPTDA